MQNEADIYYTEIRGMRSLKGALRADATYLLEENAALSDALQALAGHLDAAHRAWLSDVLVGMGRTGHQLSLRVMFQDELRGAELEAGEAEHAILAHLLRAEQEWLALEGRGETLEDSGGTLDDVRRWREAVSEYFRRRTAVMHQLRENDLSRERMQNLSLQLFDAR